MEKIKVMIVDDDDFVREGMSIILDLDDAFEVVGCAANGEEAIKLARKRKADVILMDIQMPQMDGIEATRMIVTEELGRVLILTTFDDYELVKQALQCGAKGYLIKNHTPDELKDMIRSIHNGIGVMDENIMGALAELTTIEGKKAARGFCAEQFTKRELEVIELVAKGLSNKQIAKHLFLTEGTVKNYISSILDKEDISHRTALAVYYLTGEK